MFRRVSFALLAFALSLTGLGTVIVRAASADATNLIPNPGFETSANGTAPDSWQQSNYSSTTTLNTATFSYDATSHTGNHSVSINVTKFGGGSVDWYYGDVAVTPGQTYQFSDWYKSNIDTEVDYEVNVAGATTPTYGVAGKVFASSTWKQYTTTFTAPAGATTMSMYHLIAGVGTLSTDDYSLTAYTPTPFSGPMISVTFDDGWASQDTAATQAALAGIPATYYIISDEVKTAQPVDGSDYMNQAQVKSLFAAGNEIGSHTIDHCELTTGLTEPGGPACPGFNLNNEMSQSKSTLESLVGAGNVTDFAYPYGSYNAATIAAGQPYYKSQRTVNPGYNTKDSFDATQLKMYEIDTTTTNAQVQSWVDGAVAQHAWLILTYHEVAAKAVAGDEGYNVTPANFATQMAYVKSKASLAHIETVSKALAEVQAQLGIVTPPATKPGDANGDGAVNTADLSILSTNWNKLSGATRAQGDLNGDGAVNTADLSILSTNWGK